MARHDVVRFDEVTKHYVGPAGGTTAVDGLTLGISPGEVLGLLGPNGAGKTTTLEMLVGLRRPTSGRISVLGVDPATERDTVRRQVAIQPQHAALFDHQSVEEMLRVWASLYPRPDDVDHVVEQLDLGECRAVRVRKLSGGQRQRLLVALALVSRPQLLVLDEPSTGLDPVARARLWQVIGDVRAEGRTVVLSTHSMEEAQALADRVAILHRGRLAACDRPGELVARFAPEREVEFETDPDAASALHPLRQLGSLELTPEGGRLRVRVLTTDSDAVLARLPQLCRARDVRVTDSGLDGVFRSVTAETLAGVAGEGS
ncbi:MAG TPA: ABC transporter ATP-binding protein [Angustibacter sp.]|nr:ABC transporter ATP-binding protein [Angustibacter sp.]